jgi:hypothetical protein
MTDQSETNIDNNIKSTKQSNKKILIIEEDNESPIVIINKGTGAGGANTNKNGLSYEEKTNLETLSSECTENKKNKSKIIKFIGYENELINTNKSTLHKYMENIREKDTNLQSAAGCKEPDEAYIDLTRKYIFVIEKKFQQTPGSVDEKIQTAAFKKYHYSNLFPNFKIHYIYCLSDWFKRDEYKSVLEYLSNINIPVFWGNDEEYKKNIINFMCS